jgi:predicted HTH transcriptional regulator
MKEKILKIIKRGQKIKPAEIEKKIKLSRAMIFRYLKDLQNEGKIEKIGKTPHIFYQLIEGNESRVLKSKIFFQDVFLKDFEKTDLSF